jgi:hypothetical protein
MEEIPQQIANELEELRMAEIRRLYTLMGRYRQIVSDAHRDGKITKELTVEAAKLMEQLGLKWHHLGDHWKLLNDGRSAEQIDFPPEERSTF